MKASNLRMVFRVVTLIVLVTIGAGAGPPVPAEDLAGASAHLAQTGTGRDRGVFQRIGAWPYGQALAVAADLPRQLVYLGSGGVVLVLDISDLANPQLLSDSIHTLGLVEDLYYVAATQRLFAACGEGGLEIWDVGDPSTPVQLCVFEVIYYGYETPVHNVDVLGDFAIVNCAWGFVRSIDVSDPANPVIVGGASEMGQSNDIYISTDGLLHTVGSYAYVRYIIYPDGSLHANGYYDQWTGIASLVAGSEVAAFAHQDRYLYFLDPDNLYDPVLSVIEVGRNLNDIDAQGDYVFFIRGAERELVIVDASNLYSPYQVASITIPSGPWKLDVREDHAYLAGGYSGLRAIDITDPFHPAEDGFFETFGRTATMCRSGDHGFLAEHDDGVLVLDLTDLSNPTLVGQYDTPGYTYDVKVAGDYAYIADWDGGLRIADITDPIHPMEMGVAPIAQAHVVCVAGDHAYVVDNIVNESDWIRVVDISDPENPYELGARHMESDISALAVSGDYLYAAARDLGMRVLDVSDPHNPEEVGSYVFPDVWDVETAGNYAYITSADWDGGLLTLDISDPINPVLVGIHTPYGRFFRSIALQGDFAYVTAPSYDLLYLYHIGNPANPAQIGSYTTPGGLSDLFAQDSLVYVSDGSAGLLILENELYSTPGGIVSWEPQSSGTSDHLRCVHFVDTMTGWVAGDDGTILKTSDGGENWLPQNSGTGEDLFAVFFVDPATGWAAGREGVILKTSDGGDHWDPQVSGTSQQIRSLRFVDSETGWAVGGGGTIHKTVDGGDHWQPQSSGTSETLMSVSFVDLLHGWIAGHGSGLTLRTTDGGDHWQTVYVPAQGYLTSVCFVSEEIGWVASSGNQIFKTTDGGTLWTEQYSEPQIPYSTLNSIFFLDEDMGWVVGAIEIYGQSMCTHDGGGVWTEMHGGHDNYLQSVHFVDAQHGWAVGHWGTILHTVAQASGIEEDPARPVAPPGQVLLLDNYPNPLGPATTIRYSVPRRESVALRIYNVLGQEVRTLVHEVQSPGPRSALWDGRDSKGQPVCSGIYLCTLRVGSETQSRRMTVLK
jgi:hypothetical protein